MAWFRCTIRGENFPGALAGVPGLAGFSTTRFVEAADDAEAETQVLALLRQEARLAPPPGYEPSGVARVHIENIVGVPLDDVPARQPGFAWYPMEVAA